MQQMLGLDAGGVLNGYGMTEATVTLLRETRRDKGASVGRPSAGVSIRIVDNDLNDVPPGTDGECLVRGPSVFLEYKDNPEATAEAKTSDGWLRTGDVVRADEEGYFYFVGRKKELIKFRGNQISPAELEAVLLLHESVAEAGVSGVYDSILDTEIAVGFVTLIESVSKDKQTRQASLLEIEAFVNERVAPYKKFRRPLIHLDALPKTSSGKVMRRQLTALATEMHNRKSKL
jgi:acyl-coenzyme A synthetase/AMP-(fatty) acid ligase